MPTGAAAGSAEAVPDLRACVVTAPDALVESMARQMYAAEPNYEHFGAEAGRTLEWDETDEGERDWLRHQARLALSGCTVVEEHRCVGRDKHRDVPVEGDWATPDQARGWIAFTEQDQPGRFVGERVQRRWVITTAAEEVGG